MAYEVPPINSKRKDWMWVRQQSPKEGQKNLLSDTAVDLLVWRPPEDFKLVVPDVIGSPVQGVWKTFYEACFPLNFRYERQKLADIESNNKIIAQEPAGGKVVARDDNTPIVLTIGWYVDGKSLYAAKPTNLDEPFEETFNTPGPLFIAPLK